jgi:hypothetical protein
VEGRLYRKPGIDAALLHSFLRGAARAIAHALSAAMVHTNGVDGVDVGDRLRATLRGVVTHVELAPSSPAGISFVLSRSTTEPVDVLGTSTGTFERWRNRHVTCGIQRLLPQRRGWRLEQGQWACLGAAGGTGLGAGSSILRDSQGAIETISPDREAHTLKDRSLLGTFHTYRN